LKEKHGPTKVSKTQHCSIVRSIITMFCIRTPKRSGVLTKITLQDYHKKEHKSETDTYFIYVNEHKTAAAHGSSCCPITTSLVEWIDVYISKLRPLITTESNFLFVKYNGAPLNSNDVSRELKRTWAQMGFGHTNATIFRKSSTTRMYEEVRGTICLSSSG